MQLDLDNLLEDIYSWKALLRRKDEEIEVLQNRLAGSLKQNQILEDSHLIFLEKTATFNDVLSSLHVSTSRFDDYEDEKKVLRCEVEKLKNCLNEKEKFHQNKLDELRKEMTMLKITHEKEIKAEIIGIESKASSRVKYLQNKLQEKENHQLKLEEDILKLRHEKDQYLLKIKMEYEEKLDKLRNQLSRHKRSNLHKDDFKKDDVFRQKYIKIEKESKEEIVKLKKQLEGLQSQIDFLKYSSSTANIQKEFSFNLERHQNEDSICEYEGDIVRNTKRAKPTSEYSDEDEFQIMTNKNKCNTEIVRPVKKRLFNVDLNYYVK